MHKTFVLFIFCFLLMIVITSCEFGEEDITSKPLETNSKTYDTLSIDNIVFPPDFSQSERRMMWNYYFGDNDFLSACRICENIVRVKIGNYAGEEEYGDGMGVSIFEAQILESYKGELKGNINIAWEAFSGGEHSEVYLPLYGDELILFLEKRENSDTYGIYCIFFEFDTVVLNEESYVVSQNMDVIYQLDFLLPEYEIKEYPELSHSVNKVFEEKLLYWEKMSGRDYPEYIEQEIENIFTLEDFANLINYCIKQ